MALDHAMIEPFAEGVSRPGTISYGLSSYGYDMRISNEFKVSAGTGPVDPKGMTGESFQDIVVDALVMAPHCISASRATS